MVAVPWRAAAGSGTVPLRRRSGVAGQAGLGRGESVGGGEAISVAGLGGGRPEVGARRARPVAAMAGDEARSGQQGKRAGARLSREQGRSFVRCVVVACVSGAVAKLATVTTHGREGASYTCGLIILTKFDFSNRV